MHRGLGLLSLDVSTSPRLEVWDEAPHVHPIPRMCDRCEDDEDDEEGLFCYSLVYALCPNSGAVIHTVVLTTLVTGVSHTSSRGCVGGSSFFRTCACALECECSGYLKLEHKNK